MNSPTILIIGFGSIGRRHFEILKMLYPASKISIVSHHSKQLENMYKSILDVPDLADIDYFVIASKTSCHFSDLANLDRLVSMKKILVEKPLFHEHLSFNSNNNRIFVGYNLRFHPILQKVKQELENSKILSFTAFVGQYLPNWRPNTDYSKSYSASKSEGGGVLLDLSHEIDYLQWFCGPVLQLRALVSKISDLQIDSEDYATIIGITQKKIFFNLTLEYLSREPVRTIQIQCQDRTIFCDLIKNTIRFFFDNREMEENSFTKIERNSTYMAMHRDILEDEYGTVCSLSDGFEVLNTIDKVRKSSLEDWRE